MKTALALLTRRLDDVALNHESVISWGSPIPSFGDVSRAKLATLGLNPSNREFVDAVGTELDGSLRRFHTLTSLGLHRWSDARPSHFASIYESCRRYFQNNPYDAWFKRLDYIASGTSASYYDSVGSACHLDLIPYATARKWTDVAQKQRSSLLLAVGDTLGLLLRDSPVKLLLLNGRTVVENFERIAGIRLDKELMPAWTLPRRAQPGVVGVAYTGSVDRIAGVKLRRDLVVLGYNHNIQSSFGVTKQVMTSIRHWVASSMRGAVA